MNINKRYSRDNSLITKKINPSTRCLLIGTPRTYFRVESISDIGRPETRSQISIEEEATNQRSKQAVSESEQSA
jgi:hypothetical protein